jgi:hypothetical protein
MTSPSSDDDADARGQIEPEYEFLGRFESRDAKRILKRLDEEHLSFKVEDCSEVRPDCTRVRRRSWLCIYVSSEHKEKAGAAVLEDIQL